VVHVWASPDFRFCAEDKEAPTINPNPRTSLSKLYIRPRMEDRTCCAPYRALAIDRELSRLSQDRQAEREVRSSVRSGVPASREERRSSKAWRPETPKNDPKAPRIPASALKFYARAGMNRRQRRNAARVGPAFDCVTHNVSRSRQERERETTGFPASRVFRFRSRQDPSRLGSPLSIEENSRATFVRKSIFRNIPSKRP